MEKKFTLSFDKEPALVFVQEKTGNNFALYQDGKRVTGIRKVVIYADYQDVTTHEIEFLTGHTKESE